MEAKCFNTIYKFHLKTNSFNICFADIYLKLAGNPEKDWQEIPPINPQKIISFEKRLGIRPNLG